jgi:SAM-dependent methyltransferase
MTRPEWAPPEVDIERPSVARVYDYNLGGSHNFAADRAMAEQLAAAIPDMPAANRANRALLRRIVRFLAEAGIDQYLDLGSGIPTVGNVHEVARRVRPDSRVVYVDIDPVAAAHGRAILADDPLCGVVQADLRDVDIVLGSPQVTSLLDFGRPVAVLIMAVLHFVPDASNPAGVIGRYRDATGPGSYLAISHGTGLEDGEQAAVLAEATRRASMDPAARGPAEVEKLFAGYDLVEPGIVYAPVWRPEPDQVDEFNGEHRRSRLLAGVGVRGQSGPAAASNPA